MTTTVLNTKIGKVENKIPNRAKYITTPEFNKFADSVLDTKLKTYLGTNSHVNAISESVRKNKENLEKLQTFDFFQ